MKKIVVIGGSGFLGSHVADQLSKQGNKVLIYDLKMSPWINRNQEMFIGSILNMESLLIAINGADVVYNFAGISDLNSALNSPLESIEQNILGNVTALEASRISGVKKFVYASTVYVNSREGGFYRCSKQAAENYVIEYEKKYGLKYTILRYGSLYGPRSDQKNGIRSILTKAIIEKKLIYRGSKDSLRQYIHVEDAARVSILAGNNEFDNEIIVITGQEPMRVYDMLHMVSEMMGLDKNSIEFTDEPYEGHYVTTPNAYIDRIPKKYIPSLHIDLSQGLLELIEEIAKEELKI